MQNFVKSIIAILLFNGLAACGTDSGSVDQAGNMTGAPTEGVSVTLPSSSGSDSSFSLRLTDAPIDNAVSVVMEFTAVKLRKTDGSWMRYDFDINKYPSIDLLGLQGTKTADLLVNMKIKAGDYDEIRLFVNDVPGSNYIDLGSGGVADLNIPSGSSSGLKLKGDFTIPETRPASLVIDFDLRQSVTRAGGSGNYQFNPVLRLVNNENIGHIRGTVDPALLSNPASCSDTDVDTFNAAYVYAGEIANPVDIDQSSPSSINPVTTTKIAYDNESMNYVYEAAFLPEGEYTIAFTCNADQDDLDQGGDDLKFFGTQQVKVLMNNIVFL